MTPLRTRCFTSTSSLIRGFKEGSGQWSPLWRILINYPVDKSLVSGFVPTATKVGSSSSFTGRDQHPVLTNLGEASDLMVLDFEM